MKRRWRFGPVPASILAGFLGAGVVDALVTVARAPGPSSPLAVFALSLGLYGIAGLLAAAVSGFLVGGVLGAIPGGAGGLVGPAPENERRDRGVAAALLAGTVGLVAVAITVAVGHKVVVRPMQSDLLATIAAAGSVSRWPSRWRRPSGAG
jgi:hypothetical protein